MKVIVGLGNKGKDYEGTRHNAGFDVVDEIAKASEITPVGEKLEMRNEKKFNADIVKTQADGEELVLIKPQTFMNSSGEAVSKILSYYHLGVEDLIVIFDDVDLPLGEVRVRLFGSSSGHKGMQSIIDTLGTEEFKRVRIGINSKNISGSESDQLENEIETSDFVLSKFSQRELPTYRKSIKYVSDFLVGCIGKKEEMKAMSTIVK